MTDRREWWLWLLTGLVAAAGDWVDGNCQEIKMGNKVESNIARCPDPEYAEKMIAAIDDVRVKGDSVGGVVTCIVGNLPRGLGSPVFDKLEAELAKAALSLPATEGFEFGSGFAGTFLTGSEHNDELFTNEDGRVRTRTNCSGGIQGGISNGEIINMRIAFKPTSTIISMDGLSYFKTSRMNLVDLAGSERQKLTGAAGERLKKLVISTVLFHSSGRRNNSWLGSFSTK